MKTLRERKEKEIQLFEFLLQQGYTIHTNKHMIVPNNSDFFKKIKDNELGIFFAQGNRLDIHMEQKFVNIYSRPPYYK